MALAPFYEHLREVLDRLGFRRRSQDRQAPSARRPVWVIGVPEAQAGAVREGVVGAARRAGVRPLVVPRARRAELQTFGAVRALLALLLNEIDAALREEFAEALEFVAPDLVGVSDPRPSPLDAHAVAFAIVRRISRESLQTANYIDALARLLLRLQRRATRPWVIVLERFDHLDRPSIRVLHRLQWLAEHDDTLTLIGLCAGDPLAAVPPTGHDMRSRVGQARSRLYNRIAEDLPPLCLSRAGAVLDLPPPVAELPAAFDYALRVSENLVEQNYDQAYLLAEHGLSRPLPQRVRADLYRLVGLVDANIGEYDAAQRMLSTAIEAAEHPPLRAHLHYLLALLLTKRAYDLDEAEREYRKGLAVLDAVERDDEVDFERAWLCNGLAFVAALRSRALTPEARAAALEQVLRDEIAAFKLVRRGSAPHLVYLRYNLLANMAFVLEILQRYPEAIDFWERAFGQYLGHGAQARRFEPIYRYRVALLQWKSGEFQPALDNLVSARGVAHALEDRFLTERILYGLGYVALAGDRLDLAREAFGEGLVLACELRDWPACAEHGRGAWRAATRAGDGEGAEAVRRWLTDARHPHLTEAAGTMDAAEPRPPSPKLPAYLPGIDLEPTPDVNLNVYLVSGTAALPASPPRGTVPEPAVAAVSAPGGRVRSGGD